MDISKPSEYLVPYPISSSYTFCNSPSILYIIYNLIGHLLGFTKTMVAGHLEEDRQDHL